MTGFTFLIIKTIPINTPIIPAIPRYILASIGTLKKQFIIILVIKEHANIINTIIFLILITLILFLQLSTLKRALT